MTNLSFIASRITIGLSLAEIKAHPVYGKRYEEINKEIQRLDNEYDKLSRILDRQGMDALDDKGDRIEEKASSIQDARNELVREVQKMYKTVAV